MNTHSERDEKALANAGTRPATIRFAVGDEDPQDLVAHFLRAAQLMLDPMCTRFSEAFPEAAEIDRIIEQCSLDAHRKYIQSKGPFRERLEEIAA